MKINTPPVGQASRLSSHSWKRRLHTFNYIMTAGTPVLLIVGRKAKSNQYIKYIR
jgi:hypothetical protein